MLHFLHTEGKTLHQQKYHETRFIAIHALLRPGTEAAVSLRCACAFSGQCLAIQQSAELRREPKSSQASSWALPITECLWKEKGCLVSHIGHNLLKLEPHSTLGRSTGYSSQSGSHKTHSKGHVRVGSAENGLYHSAVTFVVSNKTEGRARGLFRIM